MKVNKAHCFFEQSGTFRDAFNNLGVDAEDYDISNDFGKTDNIIDLFKEIEKAYRGKESIFDSIKPDDLIVAFFPCVRFQCSIPLAFRGEQTQQKKWSLEKKLLYSMRLHEELHRLYMVICKLFLVCLRGGVSNNN